VFVDRDVIGYAARLAAATRHPERYDLAPLIRSGASARGPIGLVQAGQALALLRGRSHVVGEDLRHRITLSYDALAEGVRPDTVVERILAAVPAPAREPYLQAVAA